MANAQDPVSIPAAPPYCLLKNLEASLAQVNVLSMANFRKKKTKRQVRCTMCTPYKWLGNSKERIKPKYRLNRREFSVMT